MYVYISKVLSQKNNKVCINSSLIHGETSCVIVILVSSLIHGETSCVIVILVVLFYLVISNMAILNTG